MNRETTLHIARLARLGLTEAEVEKFTSQLGEILDYVKSLEAVNIEGVPAYDTLDRPRVPQRQDEGVNPPSPHGELDQAPVVRQGLIVAPSPLAEVK